MSRHTLSCEAGTQLDTILGYRIDPPFEAPEDGRYLALLDPDSGTARLQFVGPPLPDPEPYTEPSRWDEFTDAELEALDHWHGMADSDYGPLDDPAYAALAAEIQAELGRRRS